MVGIGIVGIGFMGMIHFLAARKVAGALKWIEDRRENLLAAGQARIAFALMIAGALWLSLWLGRWRRWEPLSRASGFSLRSPISCARRLTSTSRRAASTAYAP